MTSSIATLAASAMPCRCPMPAALEREYRENYYAEEKPNFLAHAGEDQDWFELAQTDRLEIFETLVAARSPPPAGHRLRPGLFPQDRHRARLARHGIEPSRQAAAHARGLGAAVTEGFFGARHRRRRWAVSTPSTSPMCWSMCPTRSRILDQARDLLDAGGVLCVGVPNDFSPFQIAGRSARRRRRLVGGAAASSQLFRFRFLVARC